MSFGRLEIVTVRYFRGAKGDYQRKRIRTREMRIRQILFNTAELFETRP